MTAKKPAKPKAAAPSAAESPAKPKGRPSSYTPEIAAEIVQRLSQGEPLEKICRDEHMPCSRTVLRWKDGNESFMSDIAHAREAGFDKIAADCLDIADETASDTIEGEHGLRANTEWISRSKLRIETRLKLLAKWDPKRYGEKIAIGGADDLPPIKKMGDAELEAAIAKLMAAANDGSDE